MTERLSLSKLLVQRSRLLWLLSDILIWGEIALLLFVSDAILMFLVMFDDNGAPLTQVVWPFYLTPIGLMPLTAVVLGVVRYGLRWRRASAFLAVLVATTIVGLLIWTGVHRK